MQTRLRHIWLGSCGGLLAGAAVTLLVAWYLLSSSGTSPTTVSPSEMCDVTPLGEPNRADSGYHTVRFVAYGDVDSDDAVSCGMLPDVRIAVVERANNVYNRLNWWKAVGGSELGIEEYIPPGVRVPTTAEKLSAAPAQFITTGADGIAELVAYDPESSYYSVCAILPSDDLIAGCHNDLRIGGSTSTVYIYFTHGHAVIEARNSGRYQRFLNGVASSATPATVMFKAESAPDTVDIPENILELSDYSDAIQPRAQPIGDVNVIVVDSVYVNSWWAAVSDNGVNGLDVSRLKVGSEVFAHDWVHVVTTGPDGLAETALLPGDYLICAARRSSGRLSCVYENLASGHHTFYLTSWKGRDRLFIAHDSNDNE